MTTWTQPRWSAGDLVPGRICSRRGFAMSFAEAATRGRATAGTWADDRAPESTVAAPLGGVVLLGGAGMLGARMAARLLRDEGDAPVVIVSRNPMAIYPTWASWLGGWVTEKLMDNPRLQLIPADLGGADMSWMAAVPRSAKVFHLVAALDAFAGYGAMERTNVGSLRHAVALARRDGALLQYASTLSLQVSSNWEPLPTEHPEALLPERDNLWLYGGYAETKAAGEFALAAAAPDLVVQSVRYGLLVPEGGAPFPAGHFAQTLVTALRQVGAMPCSAETALVDLTPVDNAAGAALAMAATGQAGVFHWANKAGASLRDMVRVLNGRLVDAGQGALPVIADAEWDQRVAALPGLPRTLLRAAFRKSDFLASQEVSAMPLFNADLFQATGRKFTVGFQGYARPAFPVHLLPGLVESALTDLDRVEMQPTTGTAHLPAPR